MVRRKENIWNVPNFFTLLRFLLTFVLIYFVLANFPVMVILVIFVIAAFTDFLDGQIARRFNCVTNFGAKFDILADRFLWLSMAILLLVVFPARGIFDDYHFLQMGLIMTREILCLPFVIGSILLRKNILVAARWSGKTTTFLQGFAIPCLVLSVFYPIFNFSIYLSALTCLSGIWAFVNYLQGIGFLRKK